MKTTEIIQDLFNLGGVLTGGAALALLLGRPFAKDLDFFFADREGYEEAIKKYGDNKSLDIQHYLTPNPYDTFDLAITQLYVDKEGNFHKSERFEEAFKRMHVGLIKENVVTPSVTLLRCLKYSVNYGLKIDQEDLDYLKARNGRLHKKNRSSHH